MKKYDISSWIKLYKSKSSMEIGEIYNVSPNTVLKYLRNNGIIIRKQIPINPYNKKTFNINYFETINSEDKAYFLGLLFADGCISGNCISISLKISDKHILENFKKCINGNIKIHEYISNKKSECVISISDVKMR